MEQHRRETAKEEDQQVEQHEPEGGNADVWIVEAGPVDRDADEGEENGIAKQIDNVLQIVIFSLSAVPCGREERDFQVSDAALAILPVASGPHAQSSHVNVLPCRGRRVTFHKTRCIWRCRGDHSQQ